MIASELVEHLQGVRRNGSGWMARCPAHDDRQASLSVKDGDGGRVLLHCHAGCDAEAVVGAMGLVMRDLMPDVDGARSVPVKPPRRKIVKAYSYVTEAGELLYQVVRFDPKGFAQRRPHGEDGWQWNLEGVARVLYRLPDIVEAVGAGRPVAIVEGEKDAEALAAIDVTATTNVGGAGKWRPEYSAALAGAAVFILPDNDKPGRDHAEQVAASLQGVAKAVRVVELPGLAPKGDVSDWIAAGGTRQQLLELVRSTPDWQPREPEAEEEEPEELDAGPQWPQLDPAALGGLAGRFVGLIGPHTEADPAALLMQFLAFFGNAIGRGAYWRIEATRHYGNLFVAIVGDTAKGRKGTSLGHVRALFDRVDGDWAAKRVESGLSSGEGLIYAVRDPVDEQRRGKDGETVTERVDEGVTDKRLLVIESELANALKVMERDGNTLSPVLRDAWDGSRLGAMTKNARTRATCAHISIIGHITSQELRARLSATESANGFGNRILWASARRSKELPHGGEVDCQALADLAADVSAAAQFARERSQVPWSQTAAHLWEVVYGALSSGRSGLLGAVTGRAEAQTARLALLYALLDQSPVIRPAHLRAALAVWEYCFASAAYIFGDSLGDAHADELLRALRHAGQTGMGRSDIQDYFKRNLSKGTLTRVLDMLQAAGLARSDRQATAGRSRQAWYATDRAQAGGAGASLGLLDLAATVPDDPDADPDGPYGRVWESSVPMERPGAGIEAAAVAEEVAL